MELYFDQVNIHPIRAAWLEAHDVQLDALRTDKLHPVVSGNKWYKLDYYVQDALDKRADTIATFGGAYSNLIVATAFACMRLGVKSVGVIRGEKPATFSHTLMDAQAYGMEFIFVSREAYRDKKAIQALYPQYYWVGEGGYGEKGAQGAMKILDRVPNLAQYTHIVGAVGTGTMNAGLANAALPHQKIVGINVLKNEDLINDILRLVKKNAENVVLYNDYHFGGYAKYTPELIEFMKQTWHDHQLPTDFVYSAKSYYATEHLIKNKIIPAGSKVLYIQCGGLQGNLSLPEGTLPF